MMTHADLIAVSFSIFICSAMELGLECILELVIDL